MNMLDLKSWNNIILDETNQTSLKISHDTSLFSRQQVFYHKILYHGLFGWIYSIFQAAIEKSLIWAKGHTHMNCLMSLVYPSRPQHLSSEAYYPSISSYSCHFWSKMLKIIKMLQLFQILKTSSYTTCFPLSTLQQNYSPKV